MSEVKVAIGQHLTSKLANLTSLLVTTSTVNSIFPATPVYHHNHHHQQQSKLDSITFQPQYYQHEFNHQSDDHQHQHQHHQVTPAISGDYWSINSTTIPTSAPPLVSLPTYALQIALNVSSLFIQGSSSSPLPPSPPLTQPQLTTTTTPSVTSQGKLIEENVDPNVIIFSKGQPTIKPNPPPTLTINGNGQIPLLSPFESNKTNFITNCCNNLEQNLTKIATSTSTTTTTTATTNSSTVIATKSTEFDGDHSGIDATFSSIGDGGGQSVSPSTISVFNFHESPLNGQQLFNLTSVFDQERFTANWTNQSSSTFNNLTTTSTTLFNETIINSSYVISSESPLTTSTTLYPNGQIITANWTTEPDLRIHHPFLAILLGIICLLVMFGNILIMVAIRRERYLHTVTNLFVASLAVADCLVGAIVMPSSVVHEVMNKWWVFGQDWCDLWHSFDVLASTASILNLCVISLDRYWAITDPISYPARMTNRKAKILIALVWTCSSLISFPAILWWRAVSAPPRPLRCDFTEDVGYLLFSSIISFYGPLIIMLVVYLRIYRAAIQQTKSVKSGTKSIAATDGNESNAVVLRIHRGGGGGSVNPSSGPNISGVGGCYCEADYHHPHPHHRLHNNHQIKSSRLVGEVSFEETSEYLNCDNNNDLSSVKVSSVRHRNMKAFSLSRKLAKLAKEKKAAKTLGIVMGVFILCWLPFFIANLVKGFCGDYCLINPDLVYPLVTWLGWLNSGMNPVIYACWSRDFRRAFKKILCSWYKPKSNRGTKILQRPEGIIGGGGGCIGTVQSTRANIKSRTSKKCVKIKSNYKTSDDIIDPIGTGHNDRNNLEVDSPSDIFNQYNQSVYSTTTIDSNYNNNSNRSPKCPNDDSIGMIGLRSTSFKSTKKEPIVSDIFFLTKK